MNNSQSMEIYVRSNSNIVFLVISNVTKENQGRYECIYGRKYGLVYGDYITLLVYDSPKQLLTGITHLHEHTSLIQNMKSKYSLQDMFFK